MVGVDGLPEIDGDHVSAEDVLVEDGDHWLRPTDRIGLRLVLGPA